MSVDGKIASPSDKQVRISSEEDMKRVYQLRNSVDAILVGINTVLNDNPKLTVKEKYVSNPRHPIRIILDTQCGTPEHCLVVNEKAKTIIIKDEQVSCSKKYNDNVSVLSAPAKDGLLELDDVLDQLSKQEIKTLLVEGGGTIIWSFLKNCLVDELYVYIGSMIIGGKQTLTMAQGEGFEKETDFLQLKMISSKKLGDGVLLHYRLQ